MLQNIPLTMTQRPDLALFAHVVSRPDQEVDLAQAALLAAEHEYKDLDISFYLKRLDHLAEEADRSMHRGPMAMRSLVDKRAALEGLLDWMYGPAGFYGNTSNYYDPKNSYINEVIDRRTGIPITLAIVFIELGKRLGLPVRGVSFPGHFLVRMETSRGPEMVDPFGGCVLSREDVNSLFTRYTGRREEPDSVHLEPAPKRMILHRMLNNLSGIYSSRADSAKLCEVLTRMDILSPSPELKKRISVLGGTPYIAVRSNAVN